jgi:hypothetical protein
MINALTIDTHMKLYFVGAMDARQIRMREQIRVTLKPLQNKL